MEGTMVADVLVTHVGIGTLGHQWFGLYLVGSSVPSQYMNQYAD